MQAFIIDKKIIDKNAKKLMKEFYETIHDDYMLKTFDEFKLQRKFYDENLTKDFLSFIDREKSGKLNIADNTYRDLVEMKTEDLLSKIESEIQD